jgi:PAS domain S-box-containing protein
MGTKYGSKLALIVAVMASNGRRFWHFKSLFLITRCVAKQTGNLPPKFRNSPRNPIRDCDARSEDQYSRESSKHKREIKVPDRSNHGVNPETSLGPREREILELAADGLVDKEIAARLHIKLATVRTYWERIRTKLNALNRTQAVLLGMPHNQVERAGEELAAFAIRAINDEVISICNTQGVFLTWNKGVEAIFGYSESEWIGKHNSIIFIPEEKKESKREFKDADEAGVSVNDRWHLRKDGTRFWGTNIVLTFAPPNGLGAYAKIVRPKPMPG